MPLININGQLKIVSDEEYALYTQGSGTSPAAGGNVVQLNNTQTILLPNTTNNSPDQTLPISAQNINFTPVNVGFGTDSANGVVTPAVGTDGVANLNIIRAPANVSANVNPVADITTTTEREAAANLNIIRAPANVSANVNPVADITTTTEREAAATQSLGAPANVSPDNDPAAERNDAAAVDAANAQPGFGANPDREAEAASAAQVGRQLAQQQAVLAAQKRVVNNSDWRVRLQLAPGAQYLYNAPQPGILWPLRQTDGVIFPYTPKIMLNYKADYEQTSLTHSNYKGYFYKSSYADQVVLTATFTAQDTSEAQYLLAVIHFFRSVTKMFYGKDPTRGAPPPLVYLTGLGEYQFSQHPCAVANFSYNLPSDVDYIRARSSNVNGTNLLTRRDRQSLPTNPISGAVARLQNLFSSQGINKGAVFYPPPVPDLGQNQPTYVPTKIDIDLTLYPMQSREQISKVFDNRQFNNGAQLKGGFW